MDLSHIYLDIQEREGACGFFISVLFFCNEDIDIVLSKSFTKSILWIKTALC